MLFRDPVDGVGGRPHLGVPPRHGVEAGATSSRDERRLDWVVVCILTTSDND